MLVEFKYPFLFFLFLPVSIILFLSIKQMKNRANKKEGYCIIVLRSCLFTLLIFALTVPQLVIPQKNVPVVFLLDRSASVKGSQIPSLAGWKKASTKKIQMMNTALSPLGRNRLSNK
ncbi:hypothetical protein [Niallia sp. 03190]|uniref:hypothetical protein n=1 Tax=Niallia sp. 03190 TaxID=3458061 RepID=UPI004044DD34